MANVSLLPEFAHEVGCSCSGGLPVQRLLQEAGVDEFLPFRSYLPYNMTLPVRQASLVGHSLGIFSLLEEEPQPQSLEGMSSMLVAPEEVAR